MDSHRERESTADSDEGQEPDDRRSVSSGEKLTKRPGKLRLLIAEMRLSFLTASVTPVLLGTAIAWATLKVFLWDVFLLTLFAGCCLHLGANIANDFFDHLSGDDDINVDYIRPFSGGSRLIQQGLLSPFAVFAESMFFFILGGLIGLGLAFTRGMFILVLGIIGVASGFFYTAPPVRLVSRGIGEVFIGLNFGILMTLGGYYVQTQTINCVTILPSIPVALLITAVLYINEFPDFRADEATGKRTLVVRLGRKNAARGYAVIMTAVYLTTLFGVIMNEMPNNTLIALTTLPLSILAVRRAMISYGKSFELIPANASTVLTHLLTGLFLTLGYVLAGFEISFQDTILLGFFLLTVTLFLSVRIHRSPPPA
jgi:1,4-dihydroxy-2-naphthoate octaprenyltransferase